MDTEGRIYNKGGDVVMDGSGDKPMLADPFPITRGKQWRLRKDIRSDKETEEDIVPKLVENSRQACIVSGQKFSGEELQVRMWNTKDASPLTACWKPEMNFDKGKLCNSKNESNTIRM